MKPGRRPAQLTAEAALLLQEDSPATLHLIAAFLIYDGRENETAFEMMNEEGAFPRLVELIQQKRDGDAGLHRMLLELLYEMSRIQRLRAADLSWSLTSPIHLSSKIDEGPSVHRRRIHLLHVPDHREPLG